MKEIRIREFTDLVAWKEAHVLVVDTYRITNSFPRSELFGLSSQMRRAAVSITSNIAEGFARHSSIEKKRFFSFSRGSLFELQNQYLIARDTGFLAAKEYAHVEMACIRVRKLINGIIESAPSFATPR